jgi:hypothetical protein
VYMCVCVCVFSKADQAEMLAGVWALLGGVRAARGVSPTRARVGGCGYCSPHHRVPFTSRDEGALLATS